MRLLVVSSFFAPDRAGIAAISTDLVRGLVERGHDVTVRCAYPYYPEWRDKSGDNGWKIRVEPDFGAVVERFGIWIPKDATSVLGRLVQEASFFLSLMRRLSGGDFDLVVVFCPLLSTVGYSLVLRLFHGCPVVVNVQDLPAEAARSGGMIGPSAARAFQWFQARVLERCDAVTTLSPLMKERIVRALSAKTTVQVVPNWLSGETEEALEELRADRG